MMNKDTETTKNAPPNHNHTSIANGSAKEKKFGGAFEGFWYNILIPKFIKGDVKSTASSLSAVIVRSVIAKSATYKVSQ